MHFYTKTHIIPPATVDREVARSPCYGPPLPQPDFQSPRQCASHSNLSSPLHLSLVYSEPSISASKLCHPPLCQLYHPVCCEAPPKLPFCYNQTLSQSKSVPARPTCHCHSNPQDNLLGGRHMRRLIQERDIHHVTENIINYFLQGNMQFP